MLTYEHAPGDRLPIAALLSARLDHLRRAAGRRRRARPACAPRPRRPSQVVRHAAVDAFWNSWWRLPSPASSLISRAATVPSPSSLILPDEHEVEDPDEAAVHQVSQQRETLARPRSSTRRRRPG